MIYNSSVNLDCRFESNADPKSYMQKKSLFYGNGARCIESKIGAGSKVQINPFPNCLKTEC